MSTLQITSLEQLPSGLNFLIEKVTRLESKVSEFTNSAPMPEGYITREDAAALLKISLPKLRELTVDGTFTSYLIGSNIRYKASEITSVAPIKPSRPKKVRKI